MRPLQQKLAEFAESAAADDADAGHSISSRGTAPDLHLILSDFDVTRFPL